MSIFRFSTQADHLDIENLFKKVRSSVSSSALFNWPDKQIQEELLRSHFFIHVSSSQVIQAFIAHRVSGDVVEIMALGTDPYLRQSGMMKALLLNFVQKNSNKGFQVTLEVHEQNQPAISLYLKCGFREVHRRQSYYIDGASALVMTYLS